MKRRLWIALLAIASPDSAWAHGSIPGMEGFYWGMLHPFTFAPCLLLLMAMSLLVQQRLPSGEVALLAFGTANVAGAAVAAARLVPFDVSLPMTGLSIVVGLLVITHLPMGPRLLALAGGLAGLGSGYVAWPDTGPWNAMLFSAFGAVIGSLLIVIVISGGIEALRLKTQWPWLPVAVRVAASWVTAIAVLLGALAIKGKAL